MGLFTEKKHLREDFRGLAKMSQKRADTVAQFKKAVIEKRSL
jgi:hypothetical protein